MLVLTRRHNETIRIGDEIQVHILGMRGNQVRVGIEAPKDMSVHREEIYLRIQSQEPALHEEEVPYLRAVTED